MLSVYDAPDSIKDASTVSRLIHEILSMLDKVKKKEAKDALKKGNKQIQNEDSDSDSDDDDSSDIDYDSEDDKSEDISKKGGKRSRGNSDGMMQDEGESKPFGFTSDAAEEGKEEEGDSSDDDDYDCQVSIFDVTNILVRTFHRG